MDDFTQQPPVAVPTLPRRKTRGLTSARYQIAIGVNLASEEDFKTVESAMKSCEGLAGDEVFLVRRIKIHTTRKAVLT